MKRLYLAFLLAGLISAAFLPPLLSQQASVVGPGGLPAAAITSHRDSGTLHRSQISALDKVAVPGTITATAVTESGSVLANVAYKYAVAAGNKYGPTTPTTAASITPTATQAVRLAFAAVASADYYDIFLSTDAAPLWVGRITEAQRAAGGIFSAVGVYSAGGAVNSVDVGVVGTGIGSTTAPFNSNNAEVFAGITPVSCAGWTNAQVYFKLTVDDLRVLPVLRLNVYFVNQVTGDYHSSGNTVNPLLLSTNSTQSPLLQASSIISVQGASTMVVTVDGLTGTNAKVDVWVEKIN